MIKKMKLLKDKFVIYTKKNWLKSSVLSMFSIVAFYFLFSTDILSTIKMIGGISVFFYLLFFIISLFDNKEESADIESKVRKNKRGFLKQIFWKKEFGQDDAEFLKQKLKEFEVNK